MQTPPPDAPGASPPRLPPCIYAERERKADGLRSERIARVLAESLILQGEEEEKGGDFPEALLCALVHDLARHQRTTPEYRARVAYWAQALPSIKDPDAVAGALVRELNKSASSEATLPA